MALPTPASLRYRRQFQPVADALVDVQDAITQALRADLRRARAEVVRLRRRRGPKALRSLALALLLLPVPARAFSDLDYCRAVANVERQRCHAEHALALLDCAETLALDRWLDTGTALEDVRACRQDAAETCAECRAWLVPCGEGAQR